MNIINEIQNNTKQWNRDLNHLQNQTPTKSTTKIIQSYTNTNHKHLYHNSQQPKLRNTPLVDINLSNDPHVNVENIKFCYEDIKSPTTIKINIKKMYKSNELQIHAFETFTQINSSKQILQYVGGVVRT